MVLVTRDHLSEQEIEQFAMGKLAVTNCEQVEEHLLVCESCQIALEEMDSFLTHIRVVGARQAHNPPAVHFWGGMHGFMETPVRAMSAAVCSIAFLALVLTPWSKAPTAEPQQLSLESHRGGGADQPSVRANRAIVLSLDANGLIDSPTYQVKIVGETGKERLGSSAFAVNGKLTLNVPAGLPQGTHFVRVYGESAELLREFALVVK